MKFLKHRAFLLKNEQVVKFENLLKVAQDINAVNPLALYDFVNLILRPMQSELNLITAELGTGVVKQIGLKDLFTEKMEPYLSELNVMTVESRDSDQKLKLKSDIAFNRPWSRRRYIDNLCYLSSRRSQLASYRLEER